MATFFTRSEKKNGYGSMVSLGQTPGFCTGYRLAYRDNMTLDTKYDVWNYPDEQFIQLSTTADITTLSSDNTGDSGIAYLMRIKGLDANYNPSTQYAIPNGQNGVTLATPLIRISEIRNVGTTAIAGNLYVYTDGADVTDGVPDDTTTIRGYVPTDAQIFSTSVFTIPANCYGVLKSIAFSAYRKQATIVQAWTVTKLYNGVEIEQPAVTLNTTGSSIHVRRYEYGAYAPEKTDFWIRAEASASGTGVITEIEVELISYTAIDTSLVL